MRKAADFEVTQRIAVTVDTDAETRSAIESNRDYVVNEILATSLVFAAVEGEPTELNGHAATIAVAKA